MKCYIKTFKYILRAKLVMQIRRSCIYKIREVKSAIKDYITREVNFHLFQVNYWLRLCNRLDSLKFSHYKRIYIYRDKVLCYMLNYISFAQDIMNKK